MGEEAQCSECGRTVSYETGFSFQGTLAEGSRDRIFCPDCAPDAGKGYTLSDLEQWKEDSRVAEHARQVALMDQLGPDVYFFMRDTTQPQDALGRMVRDMGDPQSPIRRLQALNARMAGWIEGLTKDR